MTPRATDECAAEPRRLIASAEGDEPPEADDDNVIKDEILDNRPKAEPTVVHTSQQNHEQSQARAGARVGGYCAPQANANALSAYTAAK